MPETDEAFDTAYEAKQSARRQSWPPMKPHEVIFLSRCHRILLEMERAKEYNIQVQLKEAVEEFYEEDKLARRTRL